MLSSKKALVYVHICEQISSLHVFIVFLEYSGYLYKLINSVSEIELFRGWASVVKFPSNLIVVFEQPFMFT